MNAATSASRPRGRPKKLDLARIVETAIAVMDAEGIDAVSFRRVGKELGVSHMTLYTYFDSKESLLNAMVGHTLSVPALDPDPDQPWPDRLAAAMGEIHAVLVERPAIAQLLVTHPFEGDWVGEIREHLLALLEPAGLGKAETVDGISVLFNFLLGTVLVESSRGLGGSPASFELGVRLLIEGLQGGAPVRSRRAGS
jgi:AcrR family transcriptional regulator